MGLGRVSPLHNFGLELVVRFVYCVFGRKLHKVSVHPRLWAASSGQILLGALRLRKIIDLSKELILHINISYAQIPRLIEPEPIVFLLPGFLFLLGRSLNFLCSHPLLVHKLIENRWIVDRLGQIKEGWVIDWLWDVLILPPLSEEAVLAALAFVRLFRPWPRSDTHGLPEAKDCAGTVFLNVSALTESITSGRLFFLQATGWLGSSLICVLAKNNSWDRRYAISAIFPFLRACRRLPPLLKKLRVGLLEDPPRLLRSLSCLEPAMVLENSLTLIMGRPLLKIIIEYLWLYTLLMALDSFKWGVVVETPLIWELFLGIWVKWSNTCRWVLIYHNWWPWIIINIRRLVILLVTFHLYFLESLL